MHRIVSITILCAVLVGCEFEESEEWTEDADDIGVVREGLTSPAARRERAEAVRDASADKGLTNGVLLGGIAQVETGFSHCWSEATWACQGPYSSSCGGPVIAGSADGPCSAKQGGLGMFQFDGGTYAQTLARDGEEILLLDGNIEHAVDFVAIRVKQEVGGVDSNSEAIDWLNDVRVVAGDPVFEQWIGIVACRYNGCCGTCSSTRAKYRNATLAMNDEFGPGFWEISGGGGGDGGGDVTECGTVVSGSWVE